LSSAFEGIIGGKKRYPGVLDSGALDSGKNMQENDAAKHMMVVRNDLSGVELHGSLDIATKLDVMGLQVGRNSSKRRSREESAIHDSHKNKHCKKLAMGVSIKSMGAPVWFTELVEVCCPKIMKDITLNPNYGSRPVSSCSADVVFFQVNHSPLCLCTCALTTVPFVAYKVHTNNGVLFCMDKNNVYVSCMSSTCVTQHIHTRERNIQLSNYIERIYNRNNSNLSQYASRLFSSDDKKLLTGLRSMDVLQDIHVLRKVPSGNMDIGVDGKRTWVRLNRDILASVFKASFDARD
jgi:hypothetical protein